MQDLALQVRGVDLVHVDDADRADAGGGEVHRGGRAEATGTEQEHLRLEQLDLAGDADLGEQQVALVPVVLLGGERRRLLPRPSFVLPAPESAVHRLRAGVAELLHRLHGERRSHAAGAVHDDRCVLVGDAAFDLGFEVAARDVDGAGDRAFVVLVGLADVEHE